MWNGGEKMALPFENNTDRAVKKLARASLRSERRRNLLAGLIVFGAAFLLSFAAILAVNAALALEVSEGVTSDRELVTVLFGVALVVLLAAGLAIRNIMYLSVLGRTREFAQLRTLGATNRQIRCIVSAERRRMTRSWLATGVLAGFFGNVLLPLEFFWVQSASMAVAAAAFTWFVVYLSFRAPAQQAARVSPMDGLRQTAMLGIGQPRRKGHSVRPTSRPIAHHSAHLSPSAIGRRWLSSDQKKTVLTLASLIFSGALLFILFTVMAAMDCTLAWYIVATPESAVDVTQAVQRLVTADERVYVGNLADDIASYEAYFANARLAVSVLAVLILVFAFLNLLNTCIVNSVIRQREFALLAAVGMTRQQLVQAQRVENAVYFGASFFGSWLIGGALGWAICHWLSDIPGLGYIHYQFPIAFLLCYALFVAVSAFAVQRWQTHRLAEKSIVEQLREIA